MHLVDIQDLFHAVVADPRYQANLDWGRARSGHPEGTVRGHIEELESNLETLKPKLSDLEYWKLKVLIHTHDSFKRDAARGVPIAHDKSHASLARAFLAEFCDDADLLAIVQNHDVPFALWRRFDAEGEFDEKRLVRLLRSLKDWDLFLAFIIIDGCTKGKNPQRLV